LMREEEQNLLNSLNKIEGYKQLFSTYQEYEHRVMPGLITAFGECLREINGIPSKTIFMVGVPDEVFNQLYDGFTEDTNIYLLEPLIGENYDLWVIAIPSTIKKRVTWFIFPITADDFAEISRMEKLVVVVVPVGERSFDELSDRVDELLTGLGKEFETPSEKGVILIISLAGENPP